MFALGPFMWPCSGAHGMDSCTPRFRVLKQYLCLSFVFGILLFVSVLFVCFSLFLLFNISFFPLLCISINLCPYLSLFVRSCALILAHQGWLHVRHEFGFQIRWTVRGQLQRVETIVVPNQRFPLISEMGNSEHQPKPVLMHKTFFLVATYYQISKS